MSNASGFLRLFFRKNLFSEQKACFFAFWGHEKGLLHQIIKSLMQQPHSALLFLVHDPRRDSIQIISTLMSAGDTPEIRLAWPKERGRIFCSFSAASRRNPRMEV